MAGGKTGKNVTKYGGVILLGLLILGLIGFGNADFGGLQRVVAKVGSAEVPTNRYLLALNQERNAYAEQIGRPLTNQEMRDLGFDRAVLQRLINSAAMEHEAAEAGLSVGDAEVARLLRTRSDFAGIDGNFDPAAYEFVLDRLGLTPREFETTFRAEIAAGLVRAGVASAIVVPPAHARVLTDYLGESRSFSWVELTEADLPAPLPAPTEEELKAYYDTHTEEFMLPETRRITYAWLSPDKVLETIEVSDADLQDAYAARAEEFDQPERRLVERLIYADAAAAQAAMDRLTSGAASFEDLVAERGLTLEDVDMGDVTRADLDGAAEAVFALSEPGLAGPAEVPGLGFAIFRVNAILEARKTPLEDVADELRQEIAGDRARREIGDRITEFDDLLASGATVEELAAETGMELGQIDWIDGLDDGIAAYQSFAEAAAATTPEDFPEIVQMEDGGVFALRVDEIVPPRPEPFEAAREKVREAVANAALVQALAERAAEMKAAISAGARLSGFGLPTSVETRLTRGAFIDGVPEGFVEGVFALEPGGVLVQEGTRSVFVAELDEIHAADPDDPRLQQIAQAINANARQGLADDMTLMFTRAVQAEAGITFNQSALNAVQASLP